MNEDPVMETPTKSEEHPLALVAIAIGAVVGVSMSSGLSGPWDLLVGIILYFVLHSYVPAPARAGHKLIFGLIWGFCFLLVLGTIVDIIYLMNKTEIEQWFNTFPYSNKKLYIEGAPLWPRDVLHFLVWFVGVVLGWFIAIWTVWRNAGSASKQMKPATQLAESEKEVSQSKS